MSTVDPSRDPDPIEQLLLTAYPNPERKGCPGRDVLTNLAGKERDADDPNWYHVWHCSPCYAEFKQLRDARWEREKVREQRRSRATWVTVVAAALVVIVSGAVWWVQRNRRLSRSKWHKSRLTFLISMRNEMWARITRSDCTRFLARWMMCGLFCRVSVTKGNTHLRF